MKLNRFSKRLCVVVCAMLVVSAVAVGSGFAVVHGYADALLPTETVEMVSQFMQKEISEQEMGIVDEKMGTYDLVSGQRVTVGSMLEKSSLWRNPSQKGGTAGWLQKGQHVLVGTEETDGFLEVFSVRGDSMGWIDASRYVAWDMDQDLHVNGDIQTIQRLSGYGFLQNGIQFESPFDGRPMTLVRVNSDAHQVKAWADLRRNGVEQHDFVPGEFAFAMESPLPDRAYMLSSTGQVLGYSSLGTLDDRNGKAKLYFLTDGDGFEEQVDALLEQGFTLYDPDREARKLGEAQDAIDGYVRIYTEPLEETITTVQTENDTLQAQVEDLTGAVEAANQQLEAQSEQIAAMNKTIEERESELSALQETHQAMEEALDASQKAGEALQGKFDSLLEENGTLQSALDDAKKAEEALQGEIDTLQEELEALKNQALTLTGENKKIETLEAEIATLKEEAQALRDSLESSAMPTASAKPSPSPDTTKASDAK